MKVHPSEFDFLSSWNFNFKSSSSSQEGGLSSNKSWWPPSLILRGMIICYLLPRSIMKIILRNFQRYIFSLFILVFLLIWSALVRIHNFFHMNKIRHDHINAFYSNLHTNLDREIRQIVIDNRILHFKVCCYLVSFVADDQAQNLAPTWSKCRFPYYILGRNDIGK